MTTTIKFPVDKWKELPDPVDNPKEFAEAVLKQYRSLGKWPGEPNDFSRANLITHNDDSALVWIYGADNGRDCYVEIAWGDASVSLFFYVWTGDITVLDYEVKADA